MPPYRNYFDPHYFWCGTRQDFMRFIQSEKDALCEALRLDLHKNPTEAYFMEINLIEHEIQHMLDHLEEWAKPEVVSTDLLNIPGASEIRRDPLGSLGQVCCKCAKCVESGPMRGGVHGGRGGRGHLALRGRRRAGLVASVVL